MIIIIKNRIGGHMMKRVLLFVAAILTVLSASVSSAESLTYVVEDKIIHVIVDGEISDKEAQLFDDKILEFAKYLPQESFVYIDKGDGFWTEIEIAEEHETLAIGTSEDSLKDPFQQFSSALKKAIKKLRREFESITKTPEKISGVLSSIIFAIY